MALTPFTRTDNDRNRLRYTSNLTDACGPPLPLATLGVPHLARQYSAACIYW